MIDVLPGAPCQLGEGLHWDAASERLLMVDIVGRCLLQVDIADGASRVWPMPEAIGWVLPTPLAGQHAVGLKTGIALVDTEGRRELRWLDRSFPGDPLCRLNDACADRAGRIWYASMPDGGEGSAEGRVASFTRQRGVTIHDRGFGVTNGPAIAPGDRLLYANDTSRGIVYRYAFCLDSGTISRRETFLRFGAGDGLPDGMCFDVDGNLWLAMWGSGRVLQIAPDGGILRSFDLPAPNITNVCFCGPRLDRLLVSSAAVEMSEHARGQYPLAGRLFEIRGHATRGLPPATARID